MLCVHMWQCINLWHSQYLSIHSIDTTNMGLGSDKCLVIMSCCIVYSFRCSIRLDIRFWLICEIVLALICCVTPTCATYTLFLLSSKRPYNIEFKSRETSFSSDCVSQSYLTQAKNVRCYTVVSYARSWVGCAVGRTISFLYYDTWVATFTINCV